VGSHHLRGWGRSPRRAGCVALLAAALAVAALPGLAHAAPPIELISEGFGGAAADGDSLAGPNAVSADGNVVAFTSSASNLVAGDTNGVDDIFVRDRSTGTTQRVSVATGGVQANAESWEPAISADGRYVAFASVATNLVPGDTNGNPSFCCDTDVFVHDRLAGATERVSVTRAGMQGSGGSLNFAGDPSISADGRYVAFVTDFNLDPSDFNGSGDVYVRDRQAGTTELVNPFAAEGPVDPVLSANGRFVAFTSAAAYDATDANRQPDVWVRDLSDGGLERASLAGDEEEGLGASQVPAIDADGSRVAFISDSSLAPTDSDGGDPDVFVRDLVAGTTEQASLAGASREVEGHAETGAGVTISADGRFVSFTDFLADRMVPGVANATGFVRDLELRRTRAVRGALANTYYLGPDGRSLVFGYFDEGLPGNYEPGIANVFHADLPPSPDGIAPQLDVPERLEVDARGEETRVHYTVTVSDDADPEPTFVCDPEAGDSFPIGETTVTCVAADEAGNEATESFVVDVRDRSAPVIEAPESIELDQTSPGGAVVDLITQFDSIVSARDEIDQEPALECSPASGTTFPVGTTTVTCTARDDDGHEVSEALEITVRAADPPPSLSASDVRVFERNGRAVAQVSLAAPAEEDTLVDYTVVHGTTDELDFDPGDFGGGFEPQGQAYFQAGEQRTRVAFPLRKDRRDELDETFQIQLDGTPHGLAAATATVTILDDDEPRVSVRGTGNGPVVFTSLDGRVLYKAAAEPGSAPEELVSLPGAPGEDDESGLADPSVSPDGGSVVYVMQGSEWDAPDRIMEVDIEGGAPREVPGVEEALEEEGGGDVRQGDIRSPIWSPDGRTLAFLFEPFCDCNHPSSAAILVEPASGDSWEYRLDDDLTTRADVRRLSWAPDMSRLAFDFLDLGEGGRHGSPEGWNWEIGVLDADTGTVTDLTDTLDVHELYPSWSPDGERIAVERRGGVWHERPRGDEIVLLPAAGGEPQPFSALDPLRSGSDRHPSWSPDGTRIAFSRLVQSGEGRFVELWSANVEGSDFARHADATFNAEEGDSEWPALSNHWGPSGPRVRENGRIAFVSDRDGNQEIYTANPDGSDPRRLTANGALDTSPDWSPEGERIVFARGPSASPVDIWAMNRDGSGQVQLTGSEGVDSAPAWSPDGGKIAFVSNRNMPDGSTTGPELWVMDADGTAVRQLTNTLASASLAPAWSPDGARIAFHSNVDGEFEAYTIDASSTPSATGDARVKLTDNVGVSDQNPSWSPDGERIAFERGSGTNVGDATKELWAMDSDGSDAMRLTTNGDYDVQPAWSPDGTRIAFESDAGNDGDREILSMPASAGAAASNVTSTAPGIADEQPDWGVATGVPEPEPVGVSVADASVAEGAPGSGGRLGFELTLSRASEQPVTVDVATEDESAVAPGDYEAIGDRAVTFAPGETAQTVTVSVAGDDVDEADEHLFLVVTEAVGAEVDDGRGRGTIADDDPEPSLSIDDVSVAEGNAGTVDAVFTVRLSNPSESAVSVDWAAADGTATAPADYQPAGRTLGFAPRQTSATLTVRVVGDELPEPDEAFRVLLSNPQQATIGDGEGAGAIVDDDRAPETTITGGPGGPVNDPTPTFSFSGDEDASGFECRVDDVVWEQCSSPTTVGPLSDGAYTFEVRAVSAGGAPDPTPAQRGFEVDTVAPDTSVVSGPPRATNASTPSFELSSDEDDAAIECRAVSDSRRPAYGRCARSHTTEALPDGEYMLEARAVDPAGNLDATPAARPFRVDTTAPDTSVEGPSFGEGEVQVQGEGPSGSASLEASNGGAPLTLNGTGQVALFVTCPVAAEAPCRGDLELLTLQPTVARATAVAARSRAGAMLARSRFDVAPGTASRVVLELSRSVRQRMERQGRERVLVRLTMRGADGRETSAGRRFLLRPDPRLPLVRRAGLAVGVRHGAARVRLTCVRAAPRPCRGRIELRRRGELAAARFALRRGRSAGVELALSRRARNLLRRSGRLPVVVEVMARRGTPVKAVQLTLRERSNG
jgi:TolB protein